MVKLSIKRGIKSSVIVADTWYPSLVNRKEKLQNLDIPEDGLKVHLRGYSWTAWLYILFIWSFREL